MGREGGSRVRPHGEARPGPTPHGKAQPAAPTSRRMRLSVRGYPQSALFRDPNLPECAFPLRRCSGGAGRNPPASLRGTMKSGSTGQMRSSNPPPGWRGVCAKARRSRPSGPTARKDAVGVYTNRRKWPLDAGLGHLCTLLRRELRWVTRVFQPPWDACGADGVLLQQGTFYLLALDARRGRCRCEVSESLTS